MRVNELKILGNELDIDEPAGRVFKVPTVALAFFLGDRGTHFNDVARDQFGIAWPSQNIADNTLDALPERGRTRNQPRACERHMFPGPRFGFLVGGKTIESALPKDPARPEGRNRMST